VLQLQLTLQKTSTDDIEQRLFDARAENSRLHETIYMLHMKIEKLHHARKSGKVRVNIKQLQEDLKFMEYAGEEHVYLIFSDDQFVKLDSLEDLSRDMKDVW
jgi:hypothetical protein